MNQKELFVSWLNDAYGMEVSLVETLEQHAKDAKDHPEIHSAVSTHLDETRRHAELIEERIKAMGEDTSSLKSGMSKLMGMFQGATTTAAEDSMVKNALAEYAAEHFEIASYKALIISAENLGDQESVNIFRQILDDEEKMAKWLDDNLPGVVGNMVQPSST